MVAEEDEAAAGEDDDFGVEPAAAAAAAAAPEEEDMERDIFGFAFTRYRARRLSDSFRIRGRLRNDNSSE